MKIKELIEKLQSISEENENIEIRFVVHDHYSTLNYDAQWIKGLGHLNSDANWYTLHLSLNESDGKNPKITFRK